MIHFVSQEIKKFPFLKIKSLPCFDSKSQTFPFSPSLKIRRVTYPFHTMTLALRIGSVKSSLDFGPTSRPIQPSGMPDSTVADPVAASSENLSAVTKSTGR